MRAGVRAIQLRERDLGTRDLLALAEPLRRAVMAQGAKLLINDRADLAMVLPTAGVHLRETSLPAAVVRKLLAPEQLVAVSVHSVDGVRAAEDQGADFVVLGPIYETPSKREFGAPLGLRVLEEAASRVRIPIFGIGGVTAARARDMRRAGAHGVAVISALLAAGNVGAAARELLDAVK